MLSFIDSEEEYNDASNKLERVFQKGIDIVENSFTKEFAIYRAFEFDLIYSEAFYCSLQLFLRTINGKWFLFYTLAPAPDNYFFSNFSKYSVAKVPVDTPYEQYIEFLHSDPGSSPADALIHNAETIALYSDEPIWGITGSKDLEIGIVGFKDEITKTAFLSCFQYDVFVGIKRRVDDLSEMLNLQPDTQRIHFQLTQSYLSR